MRHEKTVSVSKIKPLWEPWEEDETPRNQIPFGGTRLGFVSVSLIYIIEEGYPLL